MRIFLTLLILSAIAHAEPRTPLKEGIATLEAITARYPTLQIFLRDRKAVQNYESKLAAIFGRDQFRCESFTEVLKEVSLWMEADPSLANKLWAPRKSGAEMVSYQSPGSRHFERYQFVESPRGFHGLWADLSRGLCTDKPMRCAEPTLTLPGRWASSLEGTSVFYVEKSDEFRGNSIVISSATNGRKKVRLIAGTQGLVQETGLIEMWGKTLPEKESLAVPDNEGNLASLYSHKAIDAVSNFHFSDESGTTLMRFKPLSCDKSLKGKFAENDLKSATSVGDLGASTGSSSSAAQGALTGVLVSLQLPIEQAMAPENNKEKIEETLSKELQSPDDNRRAMAALALGLLPSAGAKQSENTWVARGPAVISEPTLSAPTRTALGQALKDSSPQVRAQAAIALSSLPVVDGSRSSNSGSVGAGGSAAQGVAGGSPPKEPSATRAPLEAALKEIIAKPEAAAANNPKAISDFTSPKGLGARAFEGMLKQGIPLDSKTKNDLWERARHGKNESDRRQARNIWAKDYLRGDIGAIRELENLFKLDSEDAREMSEEINKIAKGFCDKCDRENYPMPPG